MKLVIRLERFMPETEDFWAPRTCLHLPLPEYEAAAEMLSGAADAILTGDLDLARDLVRRADMSVLFEHAHIVMHKLDPRIQRKRPIKVPAGRLAKVASRMPSAEVERALFARDGWRCRFCGCRVVLPSARKIMSAALPGAIPWSKKKADYNHGAFYAISASLDHVVPHSVGGTNEEDNLVTACWTCQFGREHFLLEEVGLLDPRARPPVNDGWDGLGRLLTRAATPTAIAPVAPARSPQRSVVSRAEWFASLEAIHPKSSERLVQILDGYADMNVSWNLNKVLIVRVAIGEVALDILGIQSDGLVEIPWAIAGRKNAFRGFAETIADAIPGAIVYETPKHWVVSKAGKRRVNVMELLTAADTLRPALRLLQSALLADRQG
jgi:HNH endonuclease